MSLVQAYMASAKPKPIYFCMSRHLLEMKIAPQLPWKVKNKGVM